MRARFLPALLILLSAPAHAGMMDQFRDPEDGKFDMSNYLLESKGAFPLPFLITEPAVGYGGGLMVAFFQQSLAELATQREEGGAYRPPNIYAAGGFGTENGTWGALGGGLVSFHNDRWRWRGGGGYANLELTYYGADNDVSRGLDYAVKGTALVNHLLYRLGNTRTWLVARWVYLDLNSSFDLHNEQVPTVEADRRSSGLGPSVEYDSRDTIFTPGRGWLGSLDMLFYDPAFGADASFQTYRAHVFAYAPIFKRCVLGTRLDARAARGDVPFYMAPYIDMRGISAAHYQDQNTALVEEELRFNVTPRWALMGFAGVGRAWGSRQGFSDVDNRVAGGTGFRYLVARQLKMSSGVDFAWGPDDFAFYIVMGNAWR
jgi:hypothetical protein